METAMENRKKEKWMPLLISAAAAVMYFISDPTLEWAYPMYATYRIQTLVWLVRRAVLILVYGLCIYICFRKKKEGKRPDAGILPFYLLLYGGYLLASIVNSGTEHFAHWIDVALTSAVPMLLFSLMFQTERSTRQYVHVLSICYLVLLALNIIFYYFPQLYIGEAREWREEFFLGSKNRAGWPLMMGLLFGTVYVQLGGKKWEWFILILLTVANVYLVHSAMTMIGAAVFLFLTVLPFSRKLVEKTDFAVIVVLIAIIFVVLLWFLLPITTSKPVSALLEMMGKDPWLSDRYAVWYFAKEIIVKKPLLGYGLQDDSAFVPHFNDFGTTLHHAHNEMVQTLYEGGALTLILAFVLLFYTAKRLRHTGRKEVTAVCKAGLFVFLLMLQADFIPYYCWYMVAFLAHCSVLLADVPCGEIGNSR